MGTITVKRKGMNKAHGGGSYKFQTIFSEKEMVTGNRRNHSEIIRIRRIEIRHLTRRESVLSYKSGRMKYFSPFWLPFSSIHDQVNMARFFAFVVFSLFAVTAFATLGVDLSTGVTAELMNCLRKEGYNYAIPRVLRTKYL